jgi:hypothetical protein
MAAVGREAARFHCQDPARLDPPAALGGPGKLCGHTSTQNSRTLDNVKPSFNYHCSEQVTTTTTTTTTTIVLSVWSVNWWHKS